MKKLIYPAIFEKDSNCYVVSFPDLDGCVTFGDTIEEAFKFAKEVLTLHIDGMNELPKATKFEEVHVGANQRVLLVESDDWNDIIYFAKNKIPQFLDELLKKKK